MAILILTLYISVKDILMRKGLNKQIKIQVVLK